MFSDVSYMIRCITFRARVRTGVYIWVVNGPALGCLRTGMSVVVIPLWICRNMLRKRMATVQNDVVLFRPSITVDLEGVDHLRVITDQVRHVSDVSAPYWNPLKNNSPFSGVPMQVEVSGTLEGSRTDADLGVSRTTDSSVGGSEMQCTGGKDVTGLEDAIENKII